MTIYYYGIFDNPAGLENFAKNLLTSVTKKRPDIKFVILSISEKIAFEDYFLSLGCEIVRLPNYRKQPYAFYKKACSIFKNANKCDVVQINLCSYRNLPLLMACKKTKIKTIVVGHYTKVGDNKHVWLHFYARRKFRKTGVKVTNSDDVTKFMFDKKSNPIFVSNGIDSEKFKYSNEKRQLLRKKYNINEDIFVIGQIGRVATDKNQIFSLEIIKKLYEKYKNILFLMIGKEIEPAARQLIKKWNMEDYAIILGESKEPIDYWYSAIDVSLLPSLNEGLSLSLLENVANGVQLFLSTNVPVLNVKSPNVKYLPLEIDQWVKSISELIENQRNNRVNAIKNSVYDLDVFSNRYIDLYNNYDHYYKINR
jgi:glycosyltransferase involved in cell wall biosynthesis